MTPTERETLIDLLQSFRLSYTVEPDNETGLSLLDRLTPDGDDDVSRGRDEIQFLAEEIELFFEAKHDKARNQAIDDAIELVTCNQFRLMSDMVFALEKLKTIS